MSLLSSLVALALVGGAWCQETEEAPRRELAAANNAFAMNLYQAVRASTPGNVVVSPLSASAALTLTLAGTRGDTAEQLRAVLHAPSDTRRAAGGLAALFDALQNSENVTVQVANKLYLQQGFPVKQEFRDIAAGDFLSDVGDADFLNDSGGARDVINQWVEDNTAGKIKHLFADGALTADTVLVIVNAIYFNGDWQRQFPPHSTRDEEFEVSSGEKVQVPTMHQMGRFGYARLRDLNTSVLELPYKGLTTKMLIFLPDAVDGLDSLEPQLTQVNLTNLQLNRREVIVSLPKFKIESSLDLKTVLAQLGVDLLFRREADMSGLTDEPNVFVSKVVQKGFVEVSERGTEAAASTGVVAVARSGRRRPEFIADHPFLFFILGSDDVILFMGRVKNPTLTS